MNLLPAARQRETEYRLTELVEAFNGAVWEPFIPARVVVAEAQGAAAPVHDFGARARDVAAVYEALASRLLALP